MKKCPFCTKEINSSNGRHIYRCCKTLSDKIQIKFLYIKYNFPEISKREILQQKYENELKSLPDIKKDYGIDYKSILFLLDYYKIKRRTKQEGCKIIAQPKREKTLLNLYGVSHNLQKESPFYKEKQNTLKDKYGVINIFQTEFVKDIIKDKWYNGGIREKRAKAMKERYGYVNAFENRKILIKALKNSVGNKSKLCESVKNKLIQNGFEIESEFLIKEKNKLYFYDIKLNNYLIEVNGDFWHANPSIYKKNDYIKFPNNEALLVSEIWKKDKIKKNIAIKNNFYYIVVWEKDINQNIDNVIINIINNVKGKMK